MDRWKPDHLEYWFTLGARLMGTHGDILIRNLDADNPAKIWLHAFHTGHPHEAMKALIDLPYFWLRRAIMHNELQVLQPDQGDDEEVEYGTPLYGELGHWFIQVSQFTGNPEELAKKNWTDLDDFWNSVWNSGLGNVTHVDSSEVAGLMIQRYWNRWKIIQEHNAPWRKEGEQPDIEVVVDTDEYKYTIHNHWITDEILSDWELAQDGAPVPDRAIEVDFYTPIHDGCREVVLAIDNHLGS